MTELSDTQLLILNAACPRPNRLALPLPEHLRGGAAQKVVGALLAKGLVAEVAAGRGDPVWRENDDGHVVTLVATEAALDALGIEPADGPIARTGARTAATAAGESADSAAPQEPPAGRTGAREGAVREGTKQAQLVGMLKSPRGATIGEIVEATGWQPHTVRGALAGALKKRLGLMIASEKIEGRGRVYRVEH
jgi:hypothetical protein